MKMTGHLSDKRDNYIKKLVSNARAVLSNQIGLPVGALKMERILYWINNIEPLTGIDLEIFIEFNKRTTSFAIGSERLEWNKDALKLQDKNLDEIVATYKSEILDKCIEIIEKYGQSSKT